MLGAGKEWGSSGKGKLGLLEPTVGNCGSGLQYPLSANRRPAHLTLLIHAGLAPFSDTEVGGPAIQAEGGGMAGITSAVPGPIINTRCAIIRYGTHASPRPTAAPTFSCSPLRPRRWPARRRQWQRSAPQLSEIATCPCAAFLSRLDT